MNLRTVYALALIVAVEPGYVKGEAGGEDCAGGAKSLTPSMHPKG